MHSLLVSRECIFFDAVDITASQAGKPYRETEPLQHGSSLFQAGGMMPAIRRTKKTKPMMARMRDAKKTGPFLKKNGSSFWMIPVWALTMLLICLWGEPPLVEKIKVTAANAAPIKKRTSINLTEKYAATAHVAKASAARAAIKTIVFLLIIITSASIRWTWRKCFIKYQNIENYPKNFLIIMVRYKKQLCL
jgi:hypothetical protein